MSEPEPELRPKEGAVRHARVPVAAKRSLRGAAGLSVLGSALLMINGASFISPLARCFGTQG